MSVGDKRNQSYHIDLLHNSNHSIFPLPILSRILTVSLITRSNSSKVQSLYLRSPSLLATTSRSHLKPLIFRASKRRSRLHHPDWLRRSKWPSLGRDILLVQQLLQLLVLCSGAHSCLGCWVAAHRYQILVGRSYGLLLRGILRLEMRSRSLPIARKYTFAVEHSKRLMCLDAHFHS
jgi:hypothetical protein